MSTYFCQPCPTCGRMQQVRIQYLGRQVACRQCQGEFEACDPEGLNYPPPSSHLHLLQRANRLLNSVRLRERM